MKLSFCTDRRSGSDVVASKRFLAYAKADNKRIVAEDKATKEGIEPSPPTTSQSTLADCCLPAAPAKHGLSYTRRIAPSIEPNRNAMNLGPHAGPAERVMAHADTPLGASSRDTL